MRFQITTGLLAFTTALLALATGPIASAQTSDAFVAKFPSANIPSTITIATAGASGLPGKNFSVLFSLTNAGTSAPTSLQFDLTYDPAKLTFVSATGAGLTATVVSTSDVQLALTSANGIANGVAASVLFTMASTFHVSFTTLTTMNCASSNLGTPLSTGCSGGPVTVTTCTVTGDATAGVVDVQAMINEVLGISPAANDMNGDGVVNVADIQMVAGAAMGHGCVLQVARAEAHATTQRASICS